MEEQGAEIEFSPILIMEFIRQVTAGRFLNEENPAEAVCFKMKKVYYDEMMAYPLQKQFLDFSVEYDEKTEILTVVADKPSIDFFRTHKSMVELSNKYEGEYAARYKPYIEVVQ